MYRISGFLRANVNAEPDPTDQDPILITVDEGRLYAWGEIGAESDILPIDLVAELFHIEKGWPANIAEMGNMIAAYVNNFQEQGYKDCAITPRISTDDESGQVNLFLDVYDGPRYVIQSAMLDSPNAHLLFAKLQGQIFSPSEYESLLAQGGLTSNDIRLEFNASRGEASIFSSSPEP